MCKKLLCHFIIFFILIFASTPCLAFNPSSSIIYEGIDVSRWQEQIDFSAVKKSGISIVYMKTSEGKSYIDPYFEINYANAKQNNLKVGFYHYVTARNTTQAREQALFFSKVIAGKIPDCMLAMDFEDFDNLSIYEINEISKVFLQTLENETTMPALIYSNSYSATNIFSKELTKYPIWIAHYNTNAPSDNGKWKNWVRMAIY